MLEERQLYFFMFSLLTITQLSHEEAIQENVDKKLWEKV